MDKIGLLMAEGLKFPEAVEYLAARRAAREGITMSNIERFTGPRKKPTPHDREEMAAILEKLTQRVRDGEIVAVAVTGVYKDGNIYTRGTWLPGQNLFTLIGAVFMLGHDALSWTDTYPDDK